MKDEKLHTDAIATEESKFLAWFDNFWYHYKWPTIVAIFFVIVFGVCIVQSCTMEKGDILITYAGRQSVTLEDNSDIAKDLSWVLSSDGKEVKAEFSSYNVLSKEQIEALQGTKDENGNIIRPDTAFFTSQYDTFVSQLQIGSGSVLLIEKWVYDGFFDEDGKTQNLMPLVEIFGETPEGAIDEYSIMLGDTELYKNSAALRTLPADTVLCLHRKIVGQKKYDMQTDAFKVIAKIANKDTE